MRTGALRPNSGGSAIVGNSGVSVCVRSITRMRPEMMSETRCGRTEDVIASPRELPFERLGIVLVAREPILRDIARIDILDAAFQRIDHRSCERFRRQLRRQDELVPLIVDRSG